MRVASGLFSWNMAAGLLAFSSRQFAFSINHEPLSASHYFSFLSKRSGRRRGAKRLVSRTNIAKECLVVLRATRVFAKVRF